MNPLCSDCRYRLPIFPGKCSAIEGHPTVPTARDIGAVCGPEAKLFQPKPGPGYVEAVR